MGEIEKQLDKTVEELQNLLQLLTLKRDLMEIKNAPRPDVRRVSYQITILERSILENHFSAGANNVGEGDYQLKIAAKIADKY